MILTLVLGALLPTFISCETEEEKQAAEVACLFATHLYNLEFDEAYALCTPTSRRWIEFYASNLTDADLQILQSSETSALASEISCHTVNDSTATAVLRIEHALFTDSLEQKEARISDECELSLSLVKRNDAWLVKLDKALQPSHKE